MQHPKLSEGIENHVVDLLEGIGARGDKKEAEEFVRRHKLEAYKVEGFKNTWWVREIPTTLGATTNKELISICESLSETSDRMGF